MGNATDMPAASIATTSKRFDTLNNAPLAIAMAIRPLDAWPRLATAPMPIAPKLPNVRASTTPISTTPTP